ncbi:MAG: histidine kinase, partial [Lachnospiraceae bacterium]|nr:histidine kinase [Lachnospiraceae bacterium]
VLNNICQTEVNELTQEENGITYIVNEKRQVISFPNAMFMGITLDENLSMEQFIRLSGLLKNKTITINEYSDGRTGWTFYSVYDKDYMLRDIKTAQHLFIVVGAIVILFAGLLITYVVQKIIHAVTGVIQGMNQVKAGNLEVIVPVENEDEIGQIAHNFNDMTGEVRSLVSEVKIATDRLKNAEIKALEAQINPHFLYNTLDSINWMAIEKGEYEISNMLRNLGVILRYSINKSNQMTTIREMGDWVDKYISLQKVRFNNAFDYKLTIDEVAKEKKVYKLLLQPFIENAILHAFVGIEQGGKINIDIMADEKEANICIIIEDNGIGMPQEMVQLYNDRKRAIQEDGEHIGLHNAFSRMDMYYGERAAWNLTSIKDMGTVITMKIPYNTYNRED